MENTQKALKVFFIQDPVFYIQEPVPYILVQNFHIPETVPYLAESVSYKLEPTSSLRSLLVLFAILGTEQRHRSSLRRFNLTLTMKSC